MSLELSVTLTLEVQYVPTSTEVSRSVCAKTVQCCPSPSGQRTSESRKRKRESEGDTAGFVSVLKKSATEQFWVKKKGLPPHLSTHPDIRQLPIALQAFLLAHWADQERSFQAAGEEIRQDVTPYLPEKQVECAGWSCKGHKGADTAQSWSGEQSDSGDEIPVDCEVQASCTEGISIG